MRIGQRDQEFLELEVLRRLYPESTDFWEANWLAVRVEMRGGGYRAMFETEIRAEEFAHFLTELEELEASGFGFPSLKPAEPQLQLDLRPEGDHRLVARCVAQKRPGSRSQLSSTIRFDWTELTRIVHELQDITEAYPVVGRG